MGLAGKCVRRDGKAWDLVGTHGKRRKQLAWEG